MICTKNGVLFWLREYQAWHVGDAYLLPDRTLIARTHPTPYSAGQVDNIERLNAPRVQVHGIHHWFDQHKSAGTLIALPGEWTSDVDLVAAGMPETPDAQG